MYAAGRGGLQRNLHHALETVGDQRRHDADRQPVADETLDQFHQVDLEAHRVRQSRSSERLIGLPARAAACAWPTGATAPAPPPDPPPAACGG
ncbi:hypothetical protein G6F24_013291 [Rhizopus arrhizus]|nr:hypothetical protein G6F24_013291 [Rhizopus arrhizus]